MTAVVGTIRTAQQCRPVQKRFKILSQNRSHPLTLLQHSSVQRFPIRGIFYVGECPQMYIIQKFYSALKIVCVCVCVSEPRVCGEGNSELSNKLASI